MVFREEKQVEDPQQFEPQPQELQRRFHNGGGGGPSGFFAFGGSSKSSSTICRPDPNNPGHQICKKVFKETRIDPQTGHQYTTTNESEESREISRGGFFNNFSNFNNLSDSSSAVDEPRWLSRLKGIFSGNDDSSSSSTGIGFIEGTTQPKLSPSNYNNTNQSQRDFESGFGRRDPFDEFIGVSSPFRMMREIDRLFHDDFDSFYGDSHFKINQDEDEFFKDMFGFGPNTGRNDPFFNFDQNHSRFDSKYGSTTGGIPNHFSSPGYNNYPQRPAQNWPDSNNFQNNQSPPTPEPAPKIETAASKANAKIYDV